MIKKIFITLAILILLVSCSKAVDENLEKNKKIVELLIQQTPTYKNDNPELTYIEHEKLGEEHYSFKYSYSSSYAGYGKRSGFAAAVITDHIVNIEIKSLEIKKANLDDKWDILEQKLI